MDKELVGALMMALGWAILFRLLWVWVRSPRYNSVGEEMKLNTWSEKMVRHGAGPSTEHLKEYQFKKGGTPWNKGKKKRKGKK